MTRPTSERASERANERASVPLRVLKQVPLEPALIAAADETEKSDGPWGPGDAFWDWFNGPHPALRGRDPIDEIAVDEDVARTLIDSCPTATSAGRAWRESASRVLLATRADVPRPFDRVAWGEPVGGPDPFDFEALLLRFADASPLLGPVEDLLVAADPWTDQAGGLGETVGALVARANVITDDALLVPTHTTCSCGAGTFEACGCSEGGGARKKPVPWEHIDTLMPGLADDIRTVFAHLARSVAAAAPDLGPDDVGPRRSAGAR